MISLSNICQQLYSFAHCFSAFFFFFGAVHVSISSSGFVPWEPYSHSWINQLFLYCLLSSCRLTPQGIFCPRCECSPLPFCSISPASDVAFPILGQCEEAVCEFCSLRQAMASVHLLAELMALLPHFVSLLPLPRLLDALFCHISPLRLRTFVSSKPSRRSGCWAPHTWLPSFICIFNNNYYYCHFFPGFHSFIFHIYICCSHNTLMRITSH